jgi:nifR3 family TIM-barrel protein
MALKIGSIDIKYPAVLSPMAALTDIVFRRLIDEIGGVGFMVSEMISAEGIRRGNRKTVEMMRSHDFKSPQFLQLFGPEPEAMAEAAKFVENETGFHGVDLNMGCPANKVVKREAGSALLKNPPQIARIVRAVRGCTSLPLTVKIRLGYMQVNVEEVVDVLESEGIDALTVHFRLKAHRYDTPADWDYAQTVKERFSKLVIGNGDIFTVADAKERLQRVDAVMIGRGAIEDPLIFHKISGLDIIPSMAAIVDRLMELIQEYYPEKMWLSRLKAYTRYLVAKRPNAKRIRQKIYTSSDYTEAKGFFLELLRES